MNIIYSKKKTDFKGGQLTHQELKETFKEAICIHEKLLSANKNVAYFFIDPLLNSFEAANSFYFRIFDCPSIHKINTYKSGASPIQALQDAKELIECGLYDAVFLFGYEPLLTNKNVYGKAAVANAMNIFETKSIIQCYNEIAHKLSEELELNKEELVELFDLLFINFHKTYSSVAKADVSLNRGRHLTDYDADLFKLTDCANPNIDFSGGIILANDETALFLQTPAKDRIKVAGVQYSMIEGSPEKIDLIVGKKEKIFPHLRDAFLKAQNQAEINVVEEFKKRNLLLEAYTCYPPIPIALLLTTEIVDDIRSLKSFLEQFEITITGGMNFARAPWNNPALNGLIEMYQKLKNGSVSYGLVHGNGGIGEIQAVALLEKC